MMRKEKKAMTTTYKVMQNLLTLNPYSLLGSKLSPVKGIVIHWVANINFFESRKNGTKGYGSVHEIIDLNGDVIVCIPENEMVYSVKNI
jgi:N-acetylmuramoyl-L-alanine amidase